MSKFNTVDACFLCNVVIILEDVCAVASDMTHVHSSDHGHIVET